jgi:hypothetical protein
MSSSLVILFGVVKQFGRYQGRQRCTLKVMNIFKNFTKNQNGSRELAAAGIHEVKLK